MRPEHIKSNRFAPYIAPRRPLHPEAGKFSGTSVKPIAGYGLTTAAFTLLGGIGAMAQAQTPLPTEPEFPVIRLALGLPGAVFFTAVFASCAGVAGWLAYKTHSKVEVAETAPEPVAVELNRLYLPRSVREKFEEVAASKLPLV